MPWPKRLRQITKEPVHGRMLTWDPRGFCPFAQVCDNNGSNFSGVGPREYLCPVGPSRTLIRQRLRDVRSFRDMRIAKGSKHAVVAVCLLAGLLTGCSRDPNVRKQKYLESGQRYFDKGQFPEAKIQFENAIQVDSRFAEAHYKLALAAIKLGDGRTAVQELLTTVQIKPDFYEAQLDLTNVLIIA